MWIFFAWVLLALHDGFDDHLQQLEQAPSRLSEHNASCSNTFLLRRASSCAWWCQATTKERQSNTKHWAPTNSSWIASFHRLCAMLPWHVPQKKLHPPSLHPLMPDTSKTNKKFTWAPEIDTTFNGMKHIMSQNVLLVCPNLHLPFQIRTDASDFQLGLVTV